MSSFSTPRLSVLANEPGVQAGDQIHWATLTTGTGQATETTKNPTATFTNFAGLSNMSGAGFARVKIVDTLGVLGMYARIPLLTDA